VRRRTWLAVALAAAAGHARAQVPDWSLEAQRRLRDGPQANAAERLEQVRSLVAAGESALQAGDPTGAEAAFDAAANIVHSADVEMGLVRTYMQAGDYRRAVAFASHAAGAHRQVPAATALYAWLLNAGGQGVAARRFVDEARLAAPGDPALRQVHEMLDGVGDRDAEALMAAPARTAPYANGAQAAVTARAVGSGVLMDAGRHAALPAPLAHGARQLWVRNGMGQTRQATVVAGSGDAGVTVVRLDAALPDAPALQWLERAPFAGSPAFAMEFAPGSDATPAWPLLRQCFFARAAAGQPGGLLLDAAPGPRGGPVFDAQGRLAGMAVPGAAGGTAWVPVSSFQLPGAPVNAAPAAAAPLPRVMADALYETGLRVALQVLREG